MTGWLQAVALWYMRRLSAMSVPEFGYRIIEAGRKITGRLQEGWVARENAVSHAVARSRALLSDRNANAGDDGRS